MKIEIERPWSDVYKSAALYARTNNGMKDMPALLLTFLSLKNPELLEKVFDRVIDSPKMLRNFVQIMRSGVVGRKSLGTRPKKLVQKWLENASDHTLLNATVGNKPSIADVIKMVHPQPSNPSREAFYRWIIGKGVDISKLPEIVQQYEHAKKGEADYPKIDFRLLTSNPLTTEQWTDIALNASWTATRMNLNTFARHGVFEANQKDVINVIAQRLQNPELVRKSGVYPYQIFSAYLNMDNGIPLKIKEALQDALEVVTENVPKIQGKTIIAVDISISMNSPITGYRKGATSKVTCIQVAALFATTLFRQNPDAIIYVFNDRLGHLHLNPRDTIITNAQKISMLLGGGTNTSLPLTHLNDRSIKADNVIYFSDNESWIDSNRFGYGRYRATETQAQWRIFHHNNPGSKLICVDLQPYANTQVKEDKDVLNIGGFNDDVFDLIAKYASNELSGSHWVGEIEKVEI